MNDAERIKEKLDIVEYIRKTVPLKKQGRNYVSACPFHSEKSPSFVVSPDRQIWHCFGACSQGGDIFSFYMKLEQVDFAEALSDLAEIAGVTLEKRSLDSSSDILRNKILEIHHLANEYYHYILTEHSLGEAGRAYLKKRGLSDKLIKTFMIGYAPDGWRNILPFLIKKGYKKEDITESGLIITKQGNSYDRFRGRIIFPLADNRGKVVGFSGRVLTNGKQAKYINSPETPIYHKSRMLFGLHITKDAIKKEGFAIICEGEFDVLSAFQEGISNIVALKGTAFTTDQLRLLKRFTPEVRLGLDMDIAGDQAARKSIQLADSMDVAVRVIQIPSGKDIDEAIKHEPIALKKAITNASSIYDFVLESAMRRHNSEDPQEKKHIGDEVLPIYANISNPIIKDHYTRRLADILSVSEESVLEAMRYQKKKDSLYSSKPEKKDTPKQSIVDTPAFHLLCLVIQGKDTAKNLQIIHKTRTIDFISNGPIKQIFEKLVSADPKNLESIDSLLPRELIDIYNKAFLSDIGTLISDTKLFEKELNRTIVALKKSSLYQRKLAIAQELKKPDADIEKLNKDLNIIISEYSKT